METNVTNAVNTNVQLPELTELEKAVLEKCAMRHFNPEFAPENEQDAHISLLEKAEAYEKAAGLMDEEMDFTNDCNLLVWFGSKYGMEVKRDVVALTD